MIISNIRHVIATYNFWQCSLDYLSLFYYIILWLNRIMSEDYRQESYHIGNHGVI